MSESTYNACCDTYDTHTKACVAAARKAAEPAPPITWYPCACGAEHDTPTCPFLELPKPILRTDSLAQIVRRMRSAGARFRETSGEVIAAFTVDEWADELEGFAQEATQPALETMASVDICLRIEQIRNQLDAAINLVPAKEPWRLLDRIDHDLRQLKKDIGHPSAGLDAAK